MAQAFGRVTLRMVKASRWEIVGAWLQIWTPPRDVEIAPVPRRAAAADAGARVRLACLAMSSRGAGVTVAQPFAARASLRDGRYA